MKNQLQRILGRVLIGMGVLLAAFGIHGFMQADEFRASTRILLPRQAVGGSLQPDYQSETEVIKSDGVLSNVVRLLELDFAQVMPMNALPEVKTAEAMVALRNRLDVRGVPYTRLIEIRVRGKSPRQAADCANAVVAAYRTHEYDQQRMCVISSIRLLKNELLLRERRVAELETKLNQLRETLKLPIPEPTIAELAANYPVFHKTQRELDDEKDLLTLIARKIVIEEADLQKNGGHGKIEIVEAATPLTDPVHRNKVHGLILLAAALGSFCFGVTFSRNASAATI